MKHWQNRPFYILSLLKSNNHMGVKIHQVLFRFEQSFVEKITSNLFEESFLIGKEQKKHYTNSKVENELKSIFETPVKSASKIPPKAQITIYTSHFSILVSLLVPCMTKLLSIVALTSLLFIPLMILENNATILDGIDTESQEQAFVVTDQYIEEFLSTHILQQSFNGPRIINIRQN